MLVPIEDAWMMMGLRGAEVLFALSGMALSIYLFLWREKHFLNKTLAIFLFLQMYCLGAIEFIPMVEDSPAPLRNTLLLDIVILICIAEIPILKRILKKTRLAEENR